MFHFVSFSVFDWSSSLDGDQRSGLGDMQLATFLQKLKCLDRFRIGYLLKVGNFVVQQSSLHASGID